MRRVKLNINLNVCYTWNDNICFLVETNPVANSAFRSLLHRRTILNFKQKSSSTICPLNLKLRLVLFLVSNKHPHRNVCVPVRSRTYTLLSTPSFFLSLFLLFLVPFCCSFLFVCSCLSLLCTLPSICSHFVLSLCLPSLPINLY